MYSDLSSQVKWMGHRSRQFEVGQGLLQGGIPSPDFHKTYEDPLMKNLEQSATGYHIGEIYLGTLMVADDKTVLNTTPEDLQQGLDLASNHANNERHINGIEKSQIVEFISTTNGAHHRNIFGTYTTRL
jgi:hypothetical protein